MYYLLNCVLCVTADEATTCFSTVAAAFATDVTRAVLIFPQRFSSLELFHPFFHRQTTNVYSDACASMAYEMRRMHMYVSV